MKLNNPRILIGVLGLFFLGGIIWWASRPKDDKPMPDDQVMEVVNLLASPPGEAGAQAKQPEQARDRSHSESKLDILNQILSAHDDNDMRLDTEFKNLSQEEKRAFMDRYQSLPIEDRNGRGTIVFLIGKNLTSPEDFKFLGNIFLEPYCRSLADCSQPPKSSEEDPHHSGSDEITLSYPQWTSLKALEKWASEQTSESQSALKQPALDALKSAEGFDHPKIQAYARKIYSKLGG